MLEEKGAGWGTLHGNWYAVKSFFSCFDLPLVLSREDSPKGESREGRAVTIEEIRRMMKVTDCRGRALLAFLKDTGLRVSDVAALNVGDVDLESEFPMLQLRTQKRKVIAKTFLGPESQEMLKHYLDVRRRGTEKVPPENVTDSSPLFRCSLHEVRRMSRISLSSTVHRIAKLAGVEGVSAHSFRRFFQTSLEAAGVSPTWIDRMIGHKPPSSRDPYSRPTDMQLREAYMQAYDYLRVETSVLDVKRLNSLEEKLAEKDAIIKTLVTNARKKEDDVEELRRKLKELEEKIRTFILLHGT